jgi:hypothetical protein
VGKPGLKKVLRYSVEFKGTAVKLSHMAGVEVRAQGPGLSADKVFEMPSIFIGSVNQIVDEMQGRRERYGIPYYVVPDSSLERVAPIVARLAGV